MITDGNIFNNFGKYSSFEEFQNNVLGRRLSMPKSFLFSFFNPWLIHSDPFRSELDLLKPEAGAMDPPPVE